MDASFDARRRFDLDWIRIAAFGLLILYHVGMLYVPWNFHVKSAHRSTEIEALMIALNPWRLALLFFVAGAASRFLLGKLDAGAFARQRSIRLLVPVVFGMLVIVPPQSYLEVVEKYRYAGSFVEFYAQHYLAFSPFQSDEGRNTGLILPTWNHLWFVVYLWAYTLIAALLGAVPGLVAWAEQALERSLAGVWLLLLPAALFAVLRLVLFPAFPVTHALFDDWYSHALLGSVFGLGFLLARSEAIWAGMVRFRWAALLIGLTAYAVVLVGRGLPPSDLLGVVRRVAYGFDQWCFIVAVLGFGRRWLAQADGPARRYLTDAVFAYYIVHQTAIIMLAHWLKPLGLSVGAEVSVVVLGTIAACAATYEVARRVPMLGPLFGLKWRSADDRLASAPAPRA